MRNLSTTALLVFALASCAPPSAKIPPLCNLKLDASVWVFKSRTGDGTAGIVCGIWNTVDLAPTELENAMQGALNAMSATLKPFGVLKVEPMKTVDYLATDPLTGFDQQTLFRTARGGAIIYELSYVGPGTQPGTFVFGFSAVTP